MTTISGSELFVIIILLLGTIFWILSLIKISVAEKGKQKVFWMVIVALTHVIGAVVYFTVSQINYLKGAKNDHPQSPE